MKSLYPFLALLPLLGGCEMLSELNPEAPPPATDWIEVPLSENTFIDGTGEYREGIYEIPLAAFSALEYKLGMNEGDVVVYSWTTDMEEPELLATEFHGHTEREGDAPGTLMFYKIHSDGKGSGTLKAPFTGIHGWYLANESEEDIVVLLRVAGFYTELEQ